MPETTENYHHIPVRDSGDFVDGSMRTIDLSKGQHVKAVIGKLKSDPGGSTHVQKYLFDVKFWGMAEAKKWVSEHKVRESKETGLLEAVWNTAYVNDLPDSSFVWIESGGTKDEQGKTKPRGLRHLPVKDANGKLDPAHVRNALARAPQMGKKLPPAAMAKLKKFAKQLKIGEAAETRESKITDEYVEKVMESAQVDREAGFIRGVKLIGTESRTRTGKVNWRYMPKALQEFGELLEGMNWYINHPPRSKPDQVRDVRDVGGKIRNTATRETGLFADLQVAGNQSWIFDLVETCPDAVGMSLNGLGIRRFSQPVHQIEGARAAYSTDMVTDPATTRNLFESMDKESNEMDWKELTVQLLREERPDIFEEIQKEVKNSMDQDSKITELQESLKTKETELTESKQKLDELQAEKVLREKKEKAQQLVEGAKLPKEIVTEIFMESLTRAETDEEMKKLVEDRKAVVDGVKNKPQSHERKLFESGDDALSADEAKQLGEAGVAAMTM